MKRQKKPVMLQKVEMQSDEWAYENVKVEARFYSHLAYDNFLWFISLAGTLVRMDVKTGKVAYIDCGRNETKNQYIVSDRMLTYNGCIYWIDIYRQHVHEYDTETGTHQCYLISGMEGADIKNSHFIGMYVYKGSIYFCLKNAPYIVKFNLADKRWERCFAPDAEMKKQEGEWAGLCSVQVGSEIYIFGKNSAVIKVNLVDFKRESIRFPNKIADVINVIYKNDCFYLRTITGDVYIWNGAEGCIGTVYKGENTRYPFSVMAVTRHKLFLLPREAGNILIIDLETGECIEQTEYPEDLQYSDCPDAKYGPYTTEDENYIWFVNHRGNYILRINKERECVEWIKPMISSLQEEWEFRKRRGELLLLCIGTDYLRGFIKMENQESVDVKKSKNIGIQIWRALKEVW